jgi:hypothetical protein
MKRKWKRENGKWKGVEIEVKGIIFRLLFVGVLEA